MNRTLLSSASFCALVALTLATWHTAEGAASPLFIALLGIAKVGVIGWVFLELDKAWPLWAVIAGILSVVVLVGSALLITM